MDFLTSEVYIIIFQVILLLGFIFFGISIIGKVKKIESSMLTKEKDLYNIYNSLENMLEELERYMYSAKLEFKELKNTMPSFSNTNNDRSKVAIDNNELISNKKSKIIVTEVNTETKNKEIVKKDKINNLDAIDNLDEKKMESNNNINKIHSDGSLHKKVFSLKDTGLSEAEIAKELKIGKGEVELFLKLGNRERINF